jgi:hypothetical protein
MRRPRVEVARALITRLYEGRRLEHQSARRAVACIGLRCLSDKRDWHQSVCRFASADSLRMGNGPVTEWIAWPLRPEQAYRAAVLWKDALRVVLEWLRCELPWCLTWAPVLGSLHRWQQASTPNRLRRYEGAAHAERCSRPTAPPSCPDGKLLMSSQLGRLSGSHACGSYACGDLMMAECIEC